MIIYTALLISLVVVVRAAKYYHEVTVNSGDEMRLRGKIEEGLTVTTWDFEACEGCKVVLSCVILSRNCEDHLLTVYDGEFFHYHCGAETRYVSTSSIYNRMSVTIETEGYKSGSYCRIGVTKPYTNLQYDIIDSSEHGLGTGATRNTSCRCGWANRSPGRIVGGDETSVNEYPFAVLLMLRRTKYPFCGGSIITPYHVLTAAHCTFPFKGLQLSVIVGEHDVRTSRETPFTKIINVEKTLDHPQYDDKTNNFDISVLKLEEQIKFNDAVGPVCLPNFRNKNLYDEYIKIMGWGHIRTNGTSSPVLRKVNVKVIDLEICKTIYKSIDVEKPSQICTWAPNKDSCQGDSGGPLVWRNPETNRYTQVALVSYGRDCASTDPGVNIDVSFFMRWIRQKVQESSPQDLCS